KANLNPSGCNRQSPPTSIADGEPAMRSEYNVPATPIPPDEVINSATDFSRFFTARGKPASAWAIGVELELFGFTRHRLQRISPRQVQSIIRGFADRISRQVEENGYVTEAELDGVRGETGSEGAGEQGGWGVPWLGYGAAPMPELAPEPALGRLTLEPGGQVEVSGAHHPSLAGVERGLGIYVERLPAMCERREGSF